MTKFLIPFLLVFVSAAQASVSVVDERLAHQFRVDAVGYGLAADLGRAWINVTYEDASKCQHSYYHCDPREFARFKVEGLSFDAANSQIVLRQGADRTVCADVR